MNPECVVLAAGMGSRYGGLKQIDPIGPSGETIIDYSIYDAIQAGFKKIVFIIRRDIELEFKAKIGAKFSTHIDVDYAYQERNTLPKGFTCPTDRIKPWGTGHAILMAKDKISQPFLVINGDDYYGSSSFKLAANYLANARDKASADYMMVGFKLAKTLSENGSVSRGICKVDEQQNLVEVVERTQVLLSHGTLVDQSQTPALQLASDSIASMNMFGFTPSLFAHLESQFCDFLSTQGQHLKSEFYIPSVVNHMLQHKTAQVKVLQTDDQWYGVTYQEDRPSVMLGIKNLIDSGHYPKNLFN